MPTDPPARRPSPPRVDLVPLGLPALAALADGDLAGANRASPVPLGPCFAAPEWRGLWRLRRDQVAADPAAAGWVTGAIWDAERRAAVGRAGFHGPPDARGMVEVGYAVDPAFRRRGYARAALGALLERARAETLVRVVRASVRPDNAASLALVARYGFARVGEQWDDEDGAEDVYEVAAG